MRIFSELSGKSYFVPISDRQEQLHKKTGARTARVLVLDKYGGVKEDKQVYCDLGMPALEVRATPPCVLVLVKEPEESELQLKRA